MGILNFIGSIFGYLLWGLYLILRNYGLAIIIFTILLKVIMFPLTLKQQKSMAAQARLTEKQKALQKACGNDKQRYNEELQKLYEKENVSPMSGCLINLLPFPIMLGIYYSVIYPLTNTLHIAQNTINQASAYIKHIPGMTSVSTYIELDIVKNWAYLKDHLTMFSAEDVEKIESFSGGFNFLGLDLLGTPSQAGFMSFLWIIPVLCLLTSWGMQFIMNKLNPHSLESSQSQQGCMKYTMYLLPLLSAYWAYIMPSAVGIYWVASSVVGAGQSIIINKFFSNEQITAKQEAQHFLLLENNEKSVKPLPVALQNMVAEKIKAQANVNAENAAKKASKQTEKKKKASNKKEKNNSSDYMGKKL